MQLFMYSWRVTIFLQYCHDFSRIYRVPQDACSGAWHKQELFLATPSEVHCILIATTDEAAEPYIEVTHHPSMQPN